MPKVTVKILKELTNVTGVGLERLVGVAALMAQVREPVLDGPLEVGAQR